MTDSDRAVLDITFYAQILYAFSQQSTSKGPTVDAQPEVNLKEEPETSSTS